MTSRRAKENTKTCPPWRESLRASARGVWRLGFVVLLTACASGPSSEGGNGPARGMAQVQVTVYSGFHRPDTPLPDPRVHLVLDVTNASEGERLYTSRRQRLALMRKLAGDLPLKLEESLAIEVHPFDQEGVRPSARCEGSSGGARAAGALSRLAKELASEPPSFSERAILALDPDRECEIDLCRAGRELAASGVWIDVVSLGSDAVPECLQTTMPGGRPGALARSMTSEPPRFRVESSNANPGVLAEGRANAEPVRVPAGTVRVVVDLDRPESVGPFVLDAGDRTTIRILDFPLSAPGERAWVVERANDEG